MKCGRPKPKGEQAAGAEGGRGCAEGSFRRARSPEPLLTLLNRAVLGGLFFFFLIYMYI